jgi:hypothetical protein
MHTIPSPRDSIGNAMLQLWRTTSVLQHRFPDTEEGTIRFIVFCTEAVQRRLEHERME